MTTDQEWEESIKEMKAQAELGRYVFTPQDRKQDKRLKMYLSKEDSHKITRGLGYKGIVTDLDTGEKWKVYGASCGLPHCMCDARVVKV